MFIGVRGENMPNTSISLPDYQIEWISRNIQNLSGYVQNKLDEDINKKETELNSNGFLQRKYFAMSSIFLIIGIGFSTIGIAFLLRGFSYEGIFAIVLGMVVMIYGVMGIKDYKEWKKNEKLLVSPTGG